MGNADFTYVGCFGEGGLEFNSQAGQIEHSVANGSPPLLRFFGAVLPRRQAAEIDLDLDLVPRRWRWTLHVSAWYCLYDEDLISFVLFLCSLSTCIINVFQKISCNSVAFKAHCGVGYILPIGIQVNFVQVVFKIIE